MAQTENGVGFSHKLPDGTMVWARRDTWAELTQDIEIIFGNEYLTALNGALSGTVAPPAAVEAPTMTVEAVAEALNAPPPEGSTFETCPVCHSVKDRLVQGGVSKRTGKRYSAFYACPTPNCPGR